MGSFATGAGKCFLKCCFDPAEESCLVDTLVIKLKESLKVSAGVETSWKQREAALSHTDFEQDLLVLRSGCTLRYRSERHNSVESVTKHLHQS